MYLNHDQFLLLGLLIGPVFPKTEKQLEGWRLLNFPFLEGDQTCGHKKLFDK